MQDSIRQEFPLETYLSSWKLFRYSSNENIVTAEHLLASKSWKQHSKILDVGCGDGLIVREVAYRSSSPIQEIHLLDADLELLQEAYKHVSALNIVSSVKTYHCNICEQVPTCYSEVDAILAIHLAYLVPSSHFSVLIENLPKNIPLYLILDEPKSVFSSIWEKTAPKYFQRSAYAHKLISELSRDKFSIETSTITSHLKNPLSIERQDIREGILSLLCYNNFSQLTPKDKEWVAEQITNFTKNDLVYCNSTCYEIARKE
jgi:hypothetical protein